MTRLLGVLTLLVLLLAGVAPVAALQESEETVPPATAPMPLSTMLRNAGYTLSDAEARYLDADEQLTDQFVAPILTVELHAAFASDEFSRQVMMSQLRQVMALDPNSNAVPAPPSLGELERIAVARRAALRRAAEQWLSGLDASDPAWVNRGAEAYGAARQGEADWLTALRQRLTGAPAGAP
jgi:hypothetical protein